MHKVTMRILLMNPNSTDAMTRMIARTARSVANDGTEIVFATGINTPASIEGYADEALAIPPMLEEIRSAEARGVQGTVIACFDDPGLDAAREVASGPVLGICQAGIQAAMILAKRFSIVTTLPRSVPALEDLVDRYGAGRQCRKVRCIDLPVLALEEDATRTMSLLEAEVRLSYREDGAEAVVLGCAGMSDLAATITATTGVIAIDGVTIAVKWMEGLIGARMHTSKCNAYATPTLKTQ